jgi:GntR family transcriptional regulator
MPGKLETEMPTDPMWRQIAEDLRQKIENGELGTEGQPLPSELELRELYGASRNTIRDAVKWLTTRGLVAARPGQGTFVRHKIDPFVTRLGTEVDSTLGSESAAYRSEVQAQSRKPTSSIPRIEIQNANEMVAAELDMQPGDTVVSRHQERHIDSIPWSLQTTFYPMRLVTSGAAELIQAKDLPGAVPYIEKATGIKQAGWRDRIVVRAPDRNETDFFKLPDNGSIAVIETIRTGYDESGQPFRVTVTSYPADRNQFVWTVGSAPAVPGGSQPDAASPAP